MDEAQKTGIPLLSEIKLFVFFKALSTRAPEHQSHFAHMFPALFSKSYHHGFGVSSEGILQQTGQLGVPVWDVCALAVDQGGDDVPQCGQGEVDLGRFLQALTGSSSLPLSL